MKQKDDPDNYRLVNRISAVYSLRTDFKGKNMKRNWIQVNYNIGSTKVDHLRQPSIFLNYLLDFLDNDNGLNFILEVSNNFYRRTVRTTRNCQNETLSQIFSWLVSYVKRTHLRYWLVI